MSYAKWVTIAVALLLVSGVTYYGISTYMAKTLLSKSCSYWGQNKMPQWCSHNFIKITKCDKQIYLIDTQNNQCADLIITGGGGKPYYTMFSYKRNIDIQNKCNYIYRGGCKS